MNGLSFDPQIPVSLWLLLAVAGAAVWAVYARRRPAVMSGRRWGLSIGMMAAGLIAVLVLLLNPTWSQELPPPPGRPALTVLVDTSGSMATPDSQGGQTRFASAAIIAKQINDQLGGTFDVETKTFDDSAHAVQADTLIGEAKGSSTNLAAAISSVGTNQNAAGQAIVLLSDGINNTGGGTARVLDAARSAKALDMPVYACTLGGDVKTIDLDVRIRSPQDLALVGQRLPITAQISYKGLTGGRANVRLLLKGNEIAHRTEDLVASGSLDVHFMVSHDKVGVYPYEVRVDPLLGEASQANNSAPYVLRVVDEPIRVLVLEGKPYWDSKFFTRTLVSDPAIALDSVVKLTDARLLRRVLTHKKSHDNGGGKDEPVRAESWEIDSSAKGYLDSRERLRGYQVIVLGRDVESFLSPDAVANLQEWVAQDGGSLVCYRGSPTAPANQLLAKILPVRWTPVAAKENRFRLALTDRGQEMQWLGGENSKGGATELAGMPSLATATVVDTARPLAVVLAKSTSADGTQSPAVIYQPYGTGRVAVIEGAGMWRWAFLAPTYQNEENLYGSIWQSLMRWLTSGANLQPGQKYSLRADKIRFGADEPATATLLAREEANAANLPDIELSAEGSTAPARVLKPAAIGDETGMFRVNFGPLPDGRYRAKLAAADASDTSTQVVFDVRRYDQEQLDLQARPDLMARIAEDSGGAVLSGDTVSVLSERFKEHELKARPPQFVRTDAWDRWWILGGVIAIWATSWIVRRSGGLL